MKAVVWSLMVAAVAATLLGAQPLAAQTEPVAQDTIGTGEFPAIKEEVPTLPNHVVYRPRDLAAVPVGELGIYVFGNGACSADGASARMHLLEIASHGYVAIAPGTILSGPGAPPRTEAPQSNAGPRRLEAPTRSAQLTEALDWALAENKRAASPYFGRIDPKRIAVSGFSCGGLQALEVAHDPRVRTAVIMNSGVFNDGASPIAGISVTKDELRKLHGSALYVLGGPTDIAYANGMDDVRRIAHIPVSVVNIPVGHGGTYDQPNGGLAAQVVVAWLDWRLKGDAAAASKFEGERCGLCGRSDLTIASTAPTK